MFQNTSRSGVSGTRLFSEQGVTASVKGSSSGRGPYRRRPPRLRRAAASRHRLRGPGLARRDQALRSRASPARSRARSRPTNVPRSWQSTSRPLQEPTSGAAREALAPHPGSATPGVGRTPIPVRKEPSSHRSTRGPTSYCLSRFVRSARQSANSAVVLANRASSTSKEERGSERRTPNASPSLDHSGVFG